MQPDVLQLDDHNFLVTVPEAGLPFTVADLHNCGLAAPASLTDYRNWIGSKERQMIAETQKAIMRHSHVGAVLRKMPKYAARKYGTAQWSDRYGYRFGFRVRIRERRYVTFFKTCCGAT
jgi:hypothetical protein